MGEHLLLSNLQTNFQKICRTCLIGKENLQTINRIIDLLKECTSIQIDMNDDFPKSICLECINKLNTAFEFRKQCEVSQKILLQLKEFGEIPVKLGSNGNESYPQVHNRIIYNLESNEIDIKSEDSYNINEDNCDDGIKLKTNSVFSFVNTRPCSSANEFVGTSASKTTLAKKQNTHLETLNTNALHSSPFDLDDQPLNERLKIEKNDSIREDYYSDIPIQSGDEENKFNKKSIHEKLEMKEGEITVKNEHSCSKCKQSFDLEGDLEIHMLKHQKFKEYICPKCSKSFTNVAKLKRHFNTHMINKPYKCDICDKTFVGISERKRHLQNHNGKIPTIADGLPCTQCKKYFKLEVDLQIHMLIHKKFDEFICPICSKDFKNKNNLTQHLNIHMTDKPYKCKFCDKSFAGSGDRNCHLRIHTGEKPLVCSSCGERFPDSGRLSIHIKKYHIGIKNFVCTVCSKSFTFAPELRSHMRVHTGEKPYLCTECGISYSHFKDLKKHKLKHSGESPFSCTECEKNFLSNYYLKVHMRSHTGEKPYACKICKMGFARKESLVIHTRSHTGERPFSCNICEKTFKSNKNLSQHKRTHIKERC